MDTKEILQIAANLGVGGLIGALIFLVAWRELRKLLEDSKQDKQILINLVGATNTMNANLQNVVDNNTDAINELRREMQRGQK